MCVTEYFCIAKPHKRDLQTVQPRVLLSLVKHVDYLLFRTCLYNSQPTQLCQ